MRNSDHKVTGIRVLDMAEESTKTIEAMFSKVVAEINMQKTPIIDVRVTDNHCFLLLGEKKTETIK